MIDANQRMLKVNSKETLGGISPPQKRHLELEIETLENFPRDAEKLERLLKAKQRQKEEEAMHTLKTQKGWLLKLKCSRLYCIW
jgi:t-SNARE complex subunit (syntaxin)